MIRRSFVGAIVAVVAALLVACSRPPPDSTPEGVVRLWLEKMESASEDSRAMKEAYALLGPHARANLKDRADRASRGQGRRYEPHEMLAEGRFGLRFRPRTMTARIDGNEAWVDVNGEGAEEHAAVRCTREGAAWRIEPDLPDSVVPTRQLDGGL
ncbi:MAG: hypothetical protein KIT84_11780 [Labilithrix sp.]|nr:hypothetical protein [Labilithrix sp.]MCW5811690.1 hypothetical protein [Labilithrix sp.]